MTLKHNDAPDSITDENYACCACIPRWKRKEVFNTQWLPQCFTDDNEDDFLASLVLMPASATERVVKGTFGFVKSNDYILMKEETNDVHLARKIVRSESRFFFSLITRNSDPSNETPDVVRWFIERLRCNYVHMYVRTYVHMYIDIFTFVPSLN